MRKAALVTGASRGMGKAMARALLAADYDVAITAARDEPALMHASAELATAFGAERVMGFFADAGATDGAEGAIRAVCVRFGRLDVLVNNAGRGPREHGLEQDGSNSAFWDIAPAAWVEVLRGNANGAFLLARAAAPVLREQGWGRIVTVSTDPAAAQRPGFGAHAAAKAAVDALTGHMARDLAQTGVTANVLAPGGPVATAFQPEGTDTSGMLDATVLNEPLVWLCSEAANAITGARITATAWRKEDPSQSVTPIFA
ncbi:MAG: SDR family oxidoreductase [Pseudomonadota bacterium]